MKKIIGLFVVLLGFIFLVACSNNNEGNTADSRVMDETNTEAGFKTESSADAEIAMDHGDDVEVSEEGVHPEEGNIPEPERKVIYTANLHVEVKDVEKGMDDIETEITAKGGYLVETSINGREENASTNGYVTARIPQEYLQDFLLFIEDGSFRIIESSTSGQDVTEEYVDLESRLKSKRVVEERLISFMEQAEKTEDLLKISNDLAKVQEEIEQIIGRMDYLDNKVDLATVTIYLEENNIAISEQDLDTWDRAVEQFMKSIHFLLSFLSGVIVVLVGGLPILLPLGILGAIFIYLWRKKSRKSKE